MDIRSIPKARRLRAKLTLHGHTYASFATARGFNARTVKAAARGERAGKITQQIVRAILSL